MLIVISRTLLQSFTYIWKQKATQCLEKKFGILSSIILFVYNLQYTSKLLKSQLIEFSITKEHVNMYVWKCVIKKKSSECSKQPNQERIFEKKNLGFMFL